MSEYSVNQLLDKCRKRNPQAQKELYNLYSKQVMSTCMRYCNSRFEADDVFQETFIKIFKYIDQFDSKGSLEGWMRRIAANTALKHIRKHSISFISTDSDSMEEQRSLSIDAFQHLSSQDILQLINELPEGCRVVFNLYSIEGYSHKEIAEELNISEGTSKSQLHHAKKLLREKYTSSVILDVQK